MGSPSVRFSRLDPVKKVVLATVERTGIPSNRLLGRAKGSREVSRARMILMLVMRDHLKMSYPSIGRSLGNRHHATIMSGVKKALADGMMKIDASCVVEIIGEHERGI